MQHTMTIALNARAFPPSPTKAFLASTLGLGLSVAMALGTAQPSAAIDIESVPNPRDNDGWVTDMADMLSPSQEAELNEIISTLEAREGHEIAVVTVTETEPAATPKAFATELFNTWGIGKEEADNGILFLVSKGDRRTEIEVGYGLEATLPDAKVGEILRSRVTPEFKQGNFDVGILNGTEALTTVLNGDTLTPLAGTPTQSQPAYRQRSNKKTEGANYALAFLMISGIGSLSLISMLCGKGSNSSHRNNNDSSHYGGGGFGGGFDSSGGGGSDFGGGGSGGGGGGDSW